MNTENDGMSIEQFIRNFSPEVEKWAKQNIYKYIGWVGDSREGVNRLTGVLRIWRQRMILSNCFGILQQFVNVRRLISSPRCLRHRGS